MNWTFVQKNAYGSYELWCGFFHYQLSLGTFAWSSDCLIELNTKLSFHSEDDSSLLNHHPVPQIDWSCQAICFLTQGELSHVSAPLSLWPLCFFSLGMSSPIPPTSLSLYQQTWSSAWCSLTTTLANRGPACLIPPTPHSPPVRRAPPSTPSRPQQIGRTGPSPGSLATNRSTFRKSDFDMCIHRHRVWNCICYSFSQLVFQQNNFPVPCSPLFFCFFSFFFTHLHMYDSVHVVVIFISPP